MQLSARPLLDNTADQALFVGRDAVLRRIDRSLRSGLNCLVVGDPGSGKTSLVRALMFRSDQGDNPLIVTYVRANEAHTAGALLSDILDAWRAGPGESGQRANDRANSRPTSPIELLDLLTSEIAAINEPGPGVRVIVVDDVGATAGAGVFGALRDELWQVGVQWLVTTSTTQAAGLLRPPADVFFETRIELGPLTADDAAEILRRRLGDTGSVGGDSGLDPALIDAGLIDAAVGVARETPRRLLEVVRELSAEPTVGGLRLTTVSGLRARAAALEQMSRPARMLAQELEALGWASASDERLLARMGWTRPRVVQVIAELESRGLVQMREENTGRGRPRKLFRLTPAAEFSDPSREVAPE